MQTVSGYESSHRDVRVKRLPDDGGLVQTGVGTAPAWTFSFCDLQKLECRPSLSGRHWRELGAEPLAPDLLGAAAAFPVLVAAPTPTYAAVACRPGLNNREVSEVIGLADQGQVSRMMKRSHKQGPVENRRAPANCLARAWRLITPAVMPSAVMPGDSPPTAKKSLTPPRRRSQRDEK
jgi:hypothetical protein